jgi:methanogenic corrinoid protein MtbC1
MGKSVKSRSDKPLLSAIDDAGGRRFLSLVESEIIPRLINAHRAGGAAHRVAAILPVDVEVFAQTLLDPSREPAELLLDAHCVRGVPLDAIYLELFAPAARLLGDMWLVDQCSFSQVTLGLWRIRGMMHELSPSFHATAGLKSQRAGERRILLATLPGQQHTLGLSVLSEFFRRDGWIALCIPSPEPGLTQSTLSSHWFDVFGVSASMDSEVGDLEKTVRAARKTSQNPRLVVLVGGPLLLNRPELCDMIGADGTAADAPAALMLAARLVQVQQDVRLN